MKKLFFLSILLVSLMSAYGSKPVVAILGDSYSTFQGYVQPDTNLVWYWQGDCKDRTDVDSVGHTWWSILTAADSPWELGVNNSYSGSTISHRGYRNEDYKDRSFITRMDKLGDPDIILVFGATNDSWAGVPVGEYKYQDWTEPDLYTFRPAMARMMDGLKELYPKATLYFLLNTGLRPEINESAEEICRHYGVKLITLEDIDKDHGHPTQKGMRSIATQVAAGIDR